jgi:lipase chaperone LimK
MKFTYLLVILLCAMGTAQAQQKRDTVHPATANKKVKMKNELGLDKKQAAEIKASKKEYKEEKAKVEADTKLSATEKKAKMKELKKEKKARVDSTLTPEQKEKLKALKKKKSS